MMRNIALSLAYDGHAYHGWQIQDGQPTVQGTLQAAARLITKEAVKLIGCGRTDSGVHARRYIAGFRTTCAIPVGRIPVAFNSILPDDIVVLAAQDMPEDFHPIRSCIKKEYTYDIYNTPYRDPFRTTRALHFEGALPLPLLRRAAEHFIGTHDFSSMRSTGTAVKSTIRTVYTYDVLERTDGISLVVCADGFLYNMARTMAGTLLAVAAGKIDADSIPEILLSGDRKRAGATAPAHALSMTNVSFPGLFI